MHLHLSLCCAGHGTQGFVHAKGELYQQGCISSPLQESHLDPDLSAGSNHDPPFSRFQFYPCIFLASVASTLTLLQITHVTSLGTYSLGSLPRAQQGVASFAHLPQQSCIPSNCHNSIIATSVLTCLTLLEATKASHMSILSHSKHSGTLLLPLVLGTKGSHSILFGPVAQDGSLLKLLINLYDMHVS